ncbi:hypothetical protein [Mucilaginibacter gotjawali]|uniref:Uncharacterized protein n=2 Tax=Mucilaginibacter gotjawali TaxID=1550579 RepID=A0A839SJK0_9SPHI|nr:hypothetical protein [Mucilaginibacter gotjawali]MBB3057618.1 hypothetical protein [Mucilaginibacter gotjawali]BAU55280.1 hypothetical protein MgSA37_03461 [Mucilaginibacter gotjawali]
MKIYENESVNKGQPETEHTSEEDASKINKTDENGAYVATDGRSKNYKGGKKTVNGPNYDKLSEGADGDTSSVAGVFK